VSPPARGRAGRARRAVLAALFLLSGATALVYEVSWTRRLVLLVGSTSGATALLLAAYMLGLALGARLGGGPADRARRPLLLYAALEAGAAAAALLLPFLLDAAGSAPFLTAAGREPLLLAAAFLLLLLPTTLLGATLPAIAKETVEDPALAGPAVGFLYAANTLGAVGGALLAGFALVEHLGVDGSARAAAAVNLLVAAIAWRMAAARPAAPEPARPGPVGEDGAGEGADEGPAPAVVRAATVAAFAGGFVGLAAEVAWTRLLVFTMQGFTAAFAAMLGAFLLGSALGGAWFARASVGARRPLALVGWIQVGAGVAAAGTLAALFHHYALVQFLRGTLDVFASPRANHDAVLLAAAFAVLGPPAFLMGGVFTAALRAGTGGLGDLGARVGRLYAANTVGAVAGALGAGFAGVEVLGARGTAAAAAVVSLLAGLATLAASARAEGPPARPALRRILVPAAAAAVAVLVLLGHPAEPMILRSPVFLGPKGREVVLVDSREGKAGLASVVRNVRDGFTSLYTDEFLAASTEGRYRYMRMLGHIPMVLAEDPRRVLVMAFGTGTTAGSLSVHPTVERLDVVEISPEVLELAPRFAAVNRGVLDRAGRPGRPEVRVFVEDARRFVLARREEWDVITLEPLLPYTPGAVHLYTREFYELCRARLAPGGALCQWFPIHAMASEDFRALAASFVEVFPESSLWYVEETAALVGTVRPQGMPVARSAERLSAPGPLEDLRAGGLDDLAQWWSFRVCGGRVLADWIAGRVRGGGPAAPMTDERPFLEFHPMPFSAVTTWFHDNLVVALDLREREGPLREEDLAGLPRAEAAAFALRYAAASEATAAFMDGKASEQAFGYHAYLSRAARDPRRAEAEARAAEEALATAVRRYGDALRANPADRVVAAHARDQEKLRLVNEGRALLARGRAEEAVEAYRRATEVGASSGRDDAWTGLGRALLRAGRPVAAKEALERALGLFAGSRDAQALLGEALVALGRSAEARPWFARAWEDGIGPADRDAETLAARAKAESGGPDGPAPADPDAEVRQALREALAEATGPRGPGRDAAVARLRAAEGRGAEVLARLLDPDARAAADSGAVPEDRVRALSRLAVAGDPRATGIAAAIAADASAPAGLAAAAVDAAAEAGGAAALAPLLDPGRVPAAALRGRAAERLALRREAAAVDAALRALDDPDAGVRLSAATTVFSLTGRKGFDPDAPEPARRAAAAALREWWEGARAAWR
jgi:spermidine synthase